MVDDYQQIRQKLQEAFEKKDFKTALEIAKEIRDNFPDHYIAAYFNLAYIQALLKQIDDTITTLEAAYDKGAWWTAENLGAFPNIDSLKSRPKFLALLRKFQERFEEEQKKSKLKWVVREPEDFDPTKAYPILLALHWGNSTIEEFEPFWKDVVLNTGVLLALPQSSQLSAPNSYSWMDLERGLQDLEQAFSEIKEQYAIDSANVFLSGASIGGKLALEAALIQQPFPVKGVTAVIPYDINPDHLIKSKDKILEQGIKCCIVTGTEDDSYKACKDFANQLQKHNIEHMFYESVGAGHIFPTNFNEILTEIMSFLLS
ncbi:MAG: hypothetical protein ACFFCZ_09170 [Promethearchaeota archaeon]